MIYLIIICVVVAIVLVKKHQNSKLNNSQYSTLFKENTKAADIKPREIQKDKLINITTKLSSDGTYNPWTNEENPDDEYTNTIFLTMFEHGKELYTTPDGYPRWLSYELNIKNPISKHKEMIEKGLLEIENYELALSHLRVSDLKSILTEYSITPKGKKQNLIELVKQNIEENKISDRLVYKYVLSEKGKEYINKHKAYVEIRKLKRYQISAAEFNKMKSKYPPYLSVRDIAWGILNNRYNFNYINKKFGLARNELLYCAYFLEDEQKLTDSLKYYIWVLYYDVSGNHNGSSIDSYDEIILASGIIEKLQKYKEYYNDNMVENCYKNIILPNIYLTQNQFIKLLQLIFDNNYSQKLVENNLCQ